MGRVLLLPLLLLALAGVIIIDVGSPVEGKGLKGHSIRMIPPRDYLKRYGFRTLPEGKGPQKPHWVPGGDNMLTPERLYYEKKMAEWREKMKLKTKDGADGVKRDSLESLEILQA
ncbi:unnamed protein product [Allacma fusca]|uniref:Uncharacterized protein n=1 Tax=Allacma fusca TaxID=39272 RepID=A0A8J2KM58_9HEXA|nr:unnamed protein product [Allacma fusca]